MGSLKQTKDTLKHCHYLFWNIVLNFHHLFILKLALVSKSIYPFLEFRTIYHIIIIRVIKKISFESYTNKKTNPEGSNFK